jgi:hypothetical protein
MRLLFLDWIPIFLLLVLRVHLKCSPDKKQEKQKQHSLLLTSTAAAADGDVVVVVVGCQCKLKITKRRKCMGQKMQKVGVLAA